MTSRTSASRPFEAILNDERTSNAQLKAANALMDRFLTIALTGEKA